MARIGILALQGGYEAHAKCLEASHEVKLVKKVSDLEDCHGLVLPGGESTTQSKLLERGGFGSPLKAFAASGKPVLATCAGLILAAHRAVGADFEPFGWLDVTVERNAWGRQIDSFEAWVDKGAFEGIDDLQQLRAMFIRAPRIVSVGARAEVVMRYKGEPIGVQQGQVVGITCHPELVDEQRVHTYCFGGLA